MAQRVFAQKPSSVSGQTAGDGSSSDPSSVSGKAGKAGKAGVGTGISMKAIALQNRLKLHKVNNR